MTQSAAPGPPGPPVPPVPPVPPGRSFNTQIRPWDLLTACGAIGCACSAFGYFGGLWWFFDLFSHFRIQGFAGLLTLALLLTSAGRKKAAAIFGLIALVNLSTIVPLYLDAEPVITAAAQSYRGLLINVNTQTGNPESVGRAISALVPDIVVLEEVDDRWIAALTTPLLAYPHSRIMTRDDNFGIALYSKHPFTRAEIKELEEVPTVIAELELPAGRLTVIATHPLPPAGAEQSRLRNSQLAQFPAIVKAATSPVLLLGDLNATPWSYPFKKLLRDSGLRDSSQGRGVLPTWPTFCPLLGIPLDHCLHSPTLQILSKTRGPRVGSDHFPLVVDFAIRHSPGVATRASLHHVASSHGHHVYVP